MTLDINALQTLEGEDTTGLSNCTLTCGNTDGNVNVCVLGTQSNPTIHFGSDNKTS
ncbi:ALQxL family class IV lanthipeptide [Streptomyces griseochromogenes]|uniref:ALQxL family class IV lanthipeptide n=1 Tax=Streptomyces griseochromogenes TaxID=68214 RepID=UPI00378F26CD